MSSPDIPQTAEPEPVSPSEGVSVLILGVGLAAVGWPALFWLVTNTLPTVPNRWLFFALLFMNLSSTALPVIYALHRRLGRGQPPGGVLLRQAMWVGIYGAACAWLMIPRLLSIPTAVVVAVALILVEALLRLRERIGWQPG